MEIIDQSVLSKVSGIVSNELKTGAPLLPYIKKFKGELNYTNCILFHECKIISVTENEVN